MTPKEKAKDLIDKFELIDRQYTYQDYLNLFAAKQCALICVDEILKELKEIKKLYNIETLPFKYWKKVKKEINKL